jgi:hypothetical protein
MVWHALNSMRGPERLKLLQRCRTRLFGTRHVAVLMNALNTAVFLGFSYVWLTLLTGWAQQIWTRAVSEGQ